jgi:hypothetical protein
VLEAVTGREWARTDLLSVRTREEIEPGASYFVGRVHRDFARAGLGVLTTAALRARGTDALAGLLPRRSYTAGLDGYLLLGGKKDWAIAGRVAGSRVEGDVAAVDGLQRAPQHYFQRPDRKTVRLRPLATSLAGWTGDINLNRQSGNVLVNAAVWAVSPGWESNDLGFNSRSDAWGAHVVGTWRKTETDRLTRRRQIHVAKWYALNFDGERQGDGLHVFANATLRNYWAMGTTLFNGWRAHNARLTRGGPGAIAPAARAGGLWVETDSRKRVSAYAETFYERNEYGGWTLNWWSSLKVKPSSSLSVSIGPTLRRAHTIAQWVGSFEDPTATGTFGSRYVFAGFEQTEVNMTTRVNWILSPRLSLQVYAQPLVSAGDYRTFKEFTRPGGYDFRPYPAGPGGVTYDPAGQAFTVDPDGAGPAAPFTFDDPDFNFRSLRVNAVLRWEWRLGSTLYAVWVQNRTNTQVTGDFEPGRDVSGMFRAPADDVFLVKATYRIGR